MGSSRGIGMCADLVGIRMWTGGGDGPGMVVLVVVQD